MTAPTASTGAGQFPAGGVFAGSGTPATYVENGTFAVGRVVYPLALAATTGQTLLQDADPAVFALLDYFSAALSTYMGARWTEAATAAGLSAAQASTPVLQTLCFEPTEYLTQEQVTLPALAVYRMTSNESDKSSGWTATTSDMVVAWVLPPLTPGQMELLWPLTTAVRNILVRVVSQGSDPSYQSGAWQLRDAGIAELDVVSTAFAKWEAVGGKDLVIPSVALRMQLVERLEDVPGAFAAVTGGTVHLDLGEPSGDTTIVDFVQDTLSAT